MTGNPNRLMSSSPDAQPQPTRGWIFAFDHSHERSPRQLVDALGGKGANLAEMTTVLGLPVPPGFTVTTAACRAYLTTGWPQHLTEELAAAVDALEENVGRRLGDADDPLLVSVRSGARSSMPGMLDTVLDLGLTAESVRGLARQVGDRCAFDSFRRFITMYADVVLGLPLDRFRAREAKVLGVTGARAASAADLEIVCNELLGLLEQSTGQPLPDPADQLRAAAEAVFRSWDGPRARAYREHEGISHDLGTAVNVQAMVFGNRDDRSGTGVAFSRNPATGEPVPYGDFLLNAQGEDVVAGGSNTEDLEGLARRFPSVHSELVEILDRLEQHYQDLCDTEFTIESGRLWMLQTRVGKRTAAASLRIAVDLASQEGWAISRAEAVRRVRVEDLGQLGYGTLGDAGESLARGLPASPGTATGAVYFSADACVDAADRGEHVLLVRPETSPDDVHGMQVAEGIITARGGLVSHAAVVAREWGIPAVVGVDALEFTDRSVRLAAHPLKEGDVLSIDGTSGEIRRGAADTVASDTPPELETLLEWADEIAMDQSKGRSPAQRLAAGRAALRPVL